jgi:RimJ/RimL family protein N-acetyltransferase
VNLAAPPAAVDDGVVRIRRPRPDDAAAVYAAVDASRAALQQWMPWATPDYGLTDAQAWIALAAGDWPRGTLCPFVIEDVAGGELLGACGIDLVDAADRTHKLGYWVRSDRTGRGIARRAARLAAVYAFEHLDAERIEILVATANARSLAVAEALGAVREGVLRRRFALNGVRHDAVVLGLLPEELREV